MFMADGKMKYFSTRFTVRMLNTRYIPSVCYQLDDIIEPAVIELAKKGEAQMYPEKVRFVSGKPIPFKKKEIHITTEREEAGKKNKRGKKDFD
jgi:hypothetical protein